MEYIVRFGLHNENRGKIPRDVLDRLGDQWVAAVEAEGLYTGGGARRYTRLDAILDRVWIALWKWFPWLREAVDE